MIRTLLFAICSLFFLIQCAEPDPDPPNKPEVTSAEALCRSIGSDDIKKLVSGSVRVKDLDGAIDLAKPLAIVEATSLPMEMSPITGGEPLPGCKDPDGVCEATFVWSRSPDSEQIYCGENGNALQIDFEIADEAGFKNRVIISTSLQQN